jgi:hypothetical protein
MSSSQQTSTHRDREELVELMSRYGNIPDTKNWDQLPVRVFTDEFVADFSAFGTPAATVTRQAWADQSRHVFAGWTATHHAITNHLIEIDGDHATIHAHVHVEHFAPANVAAGGPNCWLVTGFYDNQATRTADGWRLNSVTLTPTHQENQELLPATMAAGAN